MKKKSGFNVKSIPDFFVNHLEKMVAVLAVLVLLFMAYSAVGRPGLSWTPDDLTRASTNAKQHIETNDVDAGKVMPQGVEGVARDWTRIAGLGRNSVPSVPVDPNQPLFEGQPFPSLEKRTVPEILPVQALLARPGLGAVRVRPQRSGGGVANLYQSSGDYGYGEVGASSGNVEGRRWVVITGLIPIARQAEIYSQIFANSTFMDPVRDRPTYVNVIIERAEGNEVDANGEPLWKPLNARDLTYEEVARWATGGPNLVDRRYIPTFPRGIGILPVAMDLPPLVNPRRLGPEVAHPPTIPLLTDTAIERLKKQEEERKAREQQIRPDQLFGRGGGASGGAGYGGYGESYDSEYGSSSYDYGSESPYGPSGMGTAGRREVVRIEHQLFRYLDFTVQPGVAYRYRVKVVASNPNFRVSPEHLEDPAQASVEYIESEFSEASPLVTVPLDSRILAVKVTAPSIPIDEPRGSICCVYFDMAKAVESSGVFDVPRRGFVANFKDQPVTTPRASASPYGSAEYSDYPSSGPPSGPRRPGQPQPPRQPVERINYETNVCIADMLGGDRLPLLRDRETVSPGRFLMLSTGGDLSVRDELADFEEFKPFQPPSARNPGGAGPGGGSPYPMEY